MDLKRAMADALDMTVNYFDREVRRHAKPEHVKRDGKRLIFYARGVLDAWYEARLKPSATPDGLDVPFWFFDLPMIDD